MAGVNEMRVPGRWRPDAGHDQIRRLRQEQPDRLRGQLSVPLAAHWRWRNAAGRRKDLAARTRLVKLLARGLRTLPAPRPRLRRGTGRPTIPPPAARNSSNNIGMHGAGQAQHVTLVRRGRKDRVLCQRARDRRRRCYGTQKFTPEPVRPWDGLAPWQNISIFQGGKFRTVRCKEVNQVCWQGGAKKQPLRLLVLAATGYRQSKNGRRQYHRPAYRRTTDLPTPAAILIQDYFDRRGSEVNHRNEQAILDVGDAEVWNATSVCKGPAVIVALYRWLLLAGRPCYGPTRTADYLPLPQWRSRPKRPSCQDLINRLRQPLTEPPTQFATGTAPPTAANLVFTAAA